MNKPQEKLREIAKEILEKNLVDFIIGYESSEGLFKPCFVSKPKEVDRLVWNRECWFNLARYLRMFKGKRVGIVAKGCDGRSVVELMKENQIERRDIIVIAVECDGIYKPVKYGSAEKIRKLANYCGRCSSRVSPIIDYFVPFGEETVLSEEGSKEIHDWLSLFKKCLKCMACVKVCPFCYCTECSIEGFKPMLVSKLRKPEELFTFHLTRALHMAGRCVECGACESACPVQIPLTDLYHELNEWFKENFNYVPGRNLKEVPPALVFTEGERIEEHAFDG